MAQDVQIANVQYSDVPALEVPKVGGGTARFTDLSGDTLDASKVLSGYTGHDASGAPFTGAYVPPSAPTGNINITHSGQTDVTNYATATVPSAEIFIGSGTVQYESVGGGYRAKQRVTIEVDSSEGDVPGWVPDGYSQYIDVSHEAIPANTTITPSTSAQTIGGANYMMEGAVTVAAMPSGTAGTPTATKGTVSNHSVTVTPSVTNTTGYITGSTKTGTAVSVSASELVSGNLAITQNGTNIDVTNYSTVSVAVEGGGGSGVQVETGVEGARTSTSSISFTGLKGQPNAFYAMVDEPVAASATATVMAFVYDGQTLHAQTLANQITYDDSSLSYTYNNGTLTITSNGATIAGSVFYLTYAYGGTSGNIDTKDVQVGSGATSITFTGLDDEPIAWACIFKSNFSTSSGYQRVVYVDYEDGNIYGVEMDSGTHNASHWTASYSNGSLTITSNGTNQGGYFHQPGYYQLTAVYGGEIEPTEIEVEPLSVTQNGTYTAPTGKAYSPVTVNVSGGSVSVGQVTWTNSSTSTVSHQFTGLSGTPKFAVLRCTTQLTRSSSNTYYYIADIIWDGTNAWGNYHLRSNGTYNNVAKDADSGFNVTVGTNSITFSSDASSRTAAPGSFYNGTYELTYVY